MLRVATVDNFQGEEAQIIIVSLYRSNKDQKVGFLRTTNQINVLLGRAQHGMYLIGNTDTYLIYLCGHRFSGYYGQRTRLAGPSASAALVMWILRCKPLSRLTSKDSAPKADASFLVIDA